jgi:hypothetical protein
MPDDARTAFLFQCGETGLFAVSLDRTGANIPVLECAHGWLLRDEFELGVQEPVPAPVEPERVIAGIEVNGYFVWRVEDL